MDYRTEHNAVGVSSVHLRDKGTKSHFHMMALDLSGDSANVSPESTPILSLESHPLLILPFF